MAKIRVDVPYIIVDGSEVLFYAPCDFAKVTGLNVYYTDPTSLEKTVKSFSFCDAEGNDLSSLDNLFAEGACVKVILDVTNLKAFVQNAVTSAYIEEKFEALQGSMDTKVSNHNSSTSAHSDIRSLIANLTTKLNALADSDDTTLDQLSEIVAYIKSNKELIDAITTSKVNVSDIIDNLTTSVATKPLSAKQGVALKSLIDSLTTTVNSHTGNTTVHITSAERTNWNDANTKKHTHSNKTVLDNTTASYTTAEQTKLSGIVEGANKTVVDSALSSTSTNPVQNKVIYSDLAGRATRQKATAVTSTTAGWYRIASSPVGQTDCTGIFKIIGAVAGYHTTAIVTAGVSYAGGANIQVLQCSQYVNSGTKSALTKMRIVYSTTATNTYAYLEVYKSPASSTTIEVTILETAGWSVVTPSTAGSIPSGYTSREVALESNTMVADKFVGDLYGNADSATKLATASAGSAAQPIYWYDGKPTPCTYTLGKSVPTNAVFTDTHYTTGLVVGASATATANATATNGNVYMNVMDNTTVRNAHKISGAGSVSVTSDANGNITISGTDTNTVYTHPNSGVTAGTYRSVTVNAQGHITGGSNPTTTVAQGGTGATTLASGKALIGNGTGAVATRDINTLSAVGNLNYGSGNASYLTTLSTLAYWDGRYSSSSSNLAYCNKGAFGDAVTKGVDTTATSGSANLITSGAMYTALAGKANTSHANADGTNGKATSIFFGHTSLVDAYTASGGTANEGIGASSKALYDCYTDLSGQIKDVAITETTIHSMKALSNYSTGANINMSEMKAIPGFPLIHITLYYKVSSTYWAIGNVVVPKSVFVTNNLPVTVFGSYSTNSNLGWEVISFKYVNATAIQLMTVSGNLTTTNLYFSVTGYKV